MADKTEIENITNNTTSIVKDENAIVKDEKIYETFDVLDEEQILAEIKGNFLEEFVYCFQQRGKEVIGLSLTGVNEAVREMNRRGLAKIKESETPPIITETNDWIQVQVYALDELNGGGSWGIKRQNKYIVNKSGDITENPFALEQALSKAQRNAKRKLIPERLMKDFIEEYRKLGKVRRVSQDDISNTVFAKKENLKPPWIFDQKRKVYNPPEEIKEIFRLGYSLFDVWTKPDRDKHKSEIMDLFSKLAGKQIKNTKELTYGEIERIRVGLQAELDKKNLTKELDKVAGIDVIDVDVEGGDGEQG